MSNTQLREFSATKDLEQYAHSCGAPDWVGALRAEARGRFAVAEWPSMRDEEWRRSDISSYEFDSYHVRPPGQVLEPSRLQEDGRRGVDPSEQATESGDTTDAGSGVSGVIAFKNQDCIEYALSREAEEAGVLFVPLSRVLSEANHDPRMAEARKAVERLWGAAVRQAENRVQLWHYSTLTHGAVLYVPRNHELRRPFELRLSYDGDKAFFAPHLFAITETGARATVTVRSSGADEGEVLVNAGFDFEVGDNGALSIAELHDLNIDSSLFSNGTGYLGRDAVGAHFVGQFGGMFSKTRVDGHLNGSGANLHLDGVYFGREDQHMDLRTVQRHNAPNALSLALYKGAMLDEARSVYQGLIYVDHDATQTDAYLTNNNLLLNDGARADSIPCLQIHTNDVKCSHGSTTGKIDRNQQHYLQTRGFSEAEAKQLLVAGYFDEVITRAPESLREQLRGIVSERILEALEED